MSPFKTPEAWFHYYDYAPRAGVKEGIERRIRQGAGGPTSLEVGAEVVGHYHGEREERSTLSIGDEVEMTFRYRGTVQTWQIRLTHIDPPTGLRDSKRIPRGDGVFGYAIQGVCVALVKEE